MNSESEIPLDYQRAFTVCAKRFEDSLDASYVKSFKEEVIINEIINELKLRKR